ncbi:MAG TPA: hypothetical protein V6D13_21175 [Halomicronema sp.]
MKEFPNCEELTTNKIIVLKENKSKMIFENPNQAPVRKIKVDGCVIKEESQKCDYVLIPDYQVEIYVELKGTDIPKAIEQLESTIELLSDNPKKIRKLCFIVSTRCPKTASDIQKIAKNFKTKYNSSFYLKNIKETYDLSTALE